jgi:WD40 repeat protein
MALANMAWILASNGMRVLTIDWDLEAPGLHRYIHPFLLDKDLANTEGLIDFFINYEIEALTPTEKDSEEPPDWYEPYTDLMRYAISLDWAGFKGKGTLDFVPAGQQGAAYSSRVNSFDWINFYNRLGGWKILEVVKDKLKNEYDYILIDSRTGVSDTSGICTVQMPDILVVFFTLNTQSILGASAAAASAQEQRKDICIYPVPTRIDPFEKDKLEAGLKFARKTFSPFLKHLSKAQQRTYWGEIEAPYIPYYAYEEILATFGDDPLRDNTILASSERLASYLTDGKVRKLEYISEELRTQVLRQFIRKVAEAEPEAVRAELKPPPSETIPYLGMRPYQITDAPIFFGREVYVERMVLSLVRRPLLVLIGASGSGKTSLLQAGFIPAVQTGQLGSETFSIMIRPGANPFESLAEVFNSYPVKHDTQASTSDVNSLSETLLKGDLLLTDMVERVLQAKPECSQVVLIVDQFEELFTLSSDVMIQKRLIETLLGGLSDGRLNLVLSVRADFYSDLLRNSNLASRLGENMLNLGGMSEDELRKVIVEPARLMGVTFEPGLDELIIDSIRGEAANLALLQVTLYELWKLRKGNLITHEAYLSIGGVKGALARRAETLYNTLNPEQREAARQVLLRLVRIGPPDLPQPVSSQTFEEQGRAVTQVLAEARLVTLGTDETSGEVTVELSHEALINEWGRLRAWLDEDREVLRLRQQLEQAAKEWVGSNRDEDVLFRGARLKQANHFVSAWSEEISPLEQDFLKASQEQSKREHKARSRMRSLATFLTVALVVVLGVAILALNNFRVAYDNLQLYQTYESKNTQLLATNAVALQRESTASMEIDLQRRTAETAQAQAEYQATLSFADSLSVQAVAQLGTQHDLALLLSVGAFDRAKTFQTRTGLFSAWQYNPRLLRFYHGHKANVNSVAFSPDGSIIASGGADNSVQFWYAETGKIIGKAPPPAHTKQVTSLAFNPDGKSLASGGADGTIRLWDSSSGTPLSLLSGFEKEITILSFSPDGRNLAAGTTDGSVILWEAASGQIIAEQNFIFDGSVNDLSFSPDGSTLAVGGADGSIQLWPADLKGEKGPIRTFDAHPNGVNSLAYSPDPDGKSLASGGCTTRQNEDSCQSGEVKVWDSTSGDLLLTIPFAQTDITSLAYSPDGRIIAAGGSEGSIFLLEILTTNSPTPTPVPVIKNLPSSTLTPVETPVPIIKDFVSQSPSAKLYLMLKGHTGRINDIAFSPNGQRLVSGSSDSTVRLWNISPDQGLNQPFYGSKVGARSVVFSSKDNLLASGGSDGQILQWDLSQPEKPVQKTLDNKAGVLSLSFSPDAKVLASGSDDQKIRLWDVSNGELISELTGHSGPVWSVVFSPVCELASNKSDSCKLASGSADGTIRFWDPSSGKMIGEPLAGHTNQVLELAFSPDGSILASGSTDTTIILWDSNKRAPLLRRPLVGHTGGVDSLAFSPDGKVLASGSEDNNIWLWEVSTGQPIGEPLAGHTSAVTSLAFSRDGDILVSGSSDDTIRFWDISTRQPLGPPLPAETGGVRSLDFSPDRRVVVSGGNDPVIRLWSASFEEWGMNSCERAGRNLTQVEWTRYFPEQTYSVICEQWPSNRN